MLHDVKRTLSKPVKSWKLALNNPKIIWNTTNNLEDRQLITRANKYSASHQAIPAGDVDTGIRRS